jgi:cytochrome c oxidase subunit 2
MQEKTGWGARLWRRATKAAAFRGFVIGVIVMVAAAAPSGRQGRSPAPRIIHVTAERFTFVPSEITIDEGARVELRISSEDTAHGFRFLGPGEIDVEIPKRGRGDITVTLDAPAPGTYAFECSRVCGAGHGFMRGTLRVNPRPVGAP